MAENLIRSTHEAAVMRTLLNRAAQSLASEGKVLEAAGALEEFRQRLDAIARDLEPAERIAAARQAIAEIDSSALPPPVPLSPTQESAQ